MGKGGKLSMWIWAIACRAEKKTVGGGSTVGTIATTVLAASSQNANAKGMIKCKAFFAESDGWGLHGVNISPVGKNDLVSLVRGIFINSPGPMLDLRFAYEKPVFAPAKGFYAIVSSDGGVIGVTTDVTEGHEEGLMLLSISEQVYNALTESIKRGNL
jgi:hypothetical protein